MSHRNVFTWLAALGLLAAAPAGALELSVDGVKLLNGKFTQQAGVRAEASFAVKGRHRLGFGGAWNPVAENSDFVMNELIPKARQHPFAASAVVHPWLAGGFYDYAIYVGRYRSPMGSGTAQWRLGVGGGYASGSIQLGLSDEKTGRVATFGEVGGNIYTQFRTTLVLGMGDRLALKLELRRTSIPTKVDRINGCDSNDLRSLAGSGLGKLSTGCNTAAFSTPQREYDMAAAKDLLSDPSSDTQKLLEGGVGLVFSL
ncbi:MAG: hypothetical protein RL199_1950 [Pseudomonadota bacterium]